MSFLNAVTVSAQLFFTIVVGMYFFNSLKQQNSVKNQINLDSEPEIEKLKKMREIKLNNPLSEKTRPSSIEEICGQEQGIKALKTALCGPNPQHVIIYGQPGIGKTTAARLVMELAKKSQNSPFAENAPFIELDATILQFDERSIADPLMGSVHDPIYQGAGAYGHAGVPQPKQGAVTNAHGGILFIDEIGELHQIQMNKLLKSLEDRKVMLTSTYYSKENKSIPRHIHDIFTNGYPADFRLVGATTKSPEEIPSALRSRCQEVFFRNLTKEEIGNIAENACEKAGFNFEEGLGKVVAQFAKNGRESVNIIQMAVSNALLNGIDSVTTEIIEEVAEISKLSKACEKKADDSMKVGVVNGLAYFSQGQGALLEIEATALKASKEGMGIVKLTGVIGEEEIQSRGSKLKRKSNITNSLENCITVIEKITEIKVKNYDIHVNFIGGAPVDGPSAGIAMFTAIYSALTNTEIPQNIAMTGEISIKGKVCPVGGVREKIEAALNAGCKKIYIPKENYSKNIENEKIVFVSNVSEITRDVFGKTFLDSYENFVVINTN